MTTAKAIKAALEAIMFVNGEPLSLKLAAEILSIDKKELYKYFQELKADYEDDCRGLKLLEANNTFQLVTKHDYAVYIGRLGGAPKEKKLSKAALEVLAIIAYKQPITKSEIDSIRGVKSERILEGLSKKELIEEKGRAEAIGRPILYGTTEAFLRYMGIEKLKELPDIDSIEETLAGLATEENEIDDDTEQISIDTITGAEDKKNES